MKGNIVLTRDVEVVEMKDLSRDVGNSSTASSPHRHHTYSISARHITNSDDNNDGTDAANTWIDGFRRAPPRSLKTASGSYQGYSSQQGPPSIHAGENRHYDIRAANVKTASTPLARELKGRHLQMIAFGGSIGTGLFVASGQSLHSGGPASVLLAYVLIGAMQYCTMQSLGELVVLFPIAGSFSAYCTRFLDPSWGFAMGWK